MLELDQILKANEINFAVLAALPAFFLSLLLLMLLRAWYKQVSELKSKFSLYLLKVNSSVMLILFLPFLSSSMKLDFAFQKDVEVVR